MDGRGEATLAKVRTTCTGCHAEVELAIHAVAVAEGGADADVGSYGFTCPRCGAHVHKALPSRLLDLLVLSGAQLVAAAGLEPRPQDAAPLSLDDLIDFHELLQGDGWFALLLAANGADR